MFFETVRGYISVLTRIFWELGPRLLQLSLWISPWHATSIGFCRNFLELFNISSLDSAFQYLFLSKRDAEICDTRERITGYVVSIIDFDETSAESLIDRPHFSTFFRNFKPLLRSSIAVPGEIWPVAEPIARWGVLWLRCFTDTYSVAKDENHNPATKCLDFLDSLELELLALL